MQPRTSLVKFACSPRTDPPGSLRRPVLRRRHGHGSSRVPPGGCSREGVLRVRARREKFLVPERLREIARRGAMPRCRNDMQDVEVVARHSREADELDVRDRASQGDRLRTGHSACRSEADEIRSLLRPCSRHPATGFLVPTRKWGKVHVLLRRVTAAELSNIFYEQVPAAAQLHFFLNRRCLFKRLFNLLGQFWPFSEMKF